MLSALFVALSKRVMEWLPLPMSLVNTLALSLSPFSNCVRVPPNTSLLGGMWSAMTALPRRPQWWHPSLQQDMYAGGSDPLAGLQGLRLLLVRSQIPHGSCPSVCPGDKPGRCGIAAVEAAVPACTSTNMHTCRHAQWRGWGGQVSHLFSMRSSSRRGTSVAYCRPAAGRDSRAIAPAWNRSLGIMLRKRPPISCRHRLRRSSACLTAASLHPAGQKY